MLVERSYLHIKDGLEDAFATMMAERGLPLLRAIEGASAVRIGRGVERPGIFILLIEWQAMAAHTAFTKMPVFQEFLALLSPFTNGGEMEHFEIEPA